MATRSGGSRSGGSKSRSSKSARSASAGSRSKSASSRSKSAGSRSTARSGSTRKRSTGARSRRTARRAPAAGRSDKSVKAFRDALDRSVTLSRERIQEVVDDAVDRGRMTRGDANELVSNLVNRGRKATDDLMRDLEKLLEQTRREVESRTGPARRQAGRAAGRAARGVRDAADRPLAEADKLRRRTRAPGPPITGYDQLTAGQVKTRLKDLNKAELRKVRTQEKRGKARKGILDDIETRLAK
jgi:polyhydroxyalkanoate synthesis regulator phasin